MELKENNLRDEKGRFTKGNNGFWLDKTRSEDTKNKISKTKKGNSPIPKHAFKEGHIPWNKGKTGVFSKETLKKMSITHKNRLKIKTNHPMYGKYHTEETIKKLIESHKGHIVSEETKEKIRKANRMENNYNWQGGISFEPYTFDFNKELKELIRKRDNYRCQLCGMPECENIEKLCIHHIDYNKKNCSSDNLITLCRKCNVKANFNRDYWTEYFKNKMEEI